MDLDGMFWPDNVAVIGASNQEGKVGNAIMKSLKRKFEGGIFPVNIKEDQILGFEAYGSVIDIKDKVDLALISLPAKIVPDIIKECGEAEIKNVIVVSAGFSEAGREDLEDKIKKIVDEYDMNLIGPNCLGIYNPWIELDTIFNPPERQARPDPGSIAFLSQSGAFGAAILDWFSESNIGLSKFISYGNRADIDEADLISYISEDEKTDYIIFYIEGVKDGRKFFEAAKKSEKPILAIKSGRTEKGSSAATSHTASLAGKDGVYEGAFKQSDVIRINTLREMFNVAKALSFQPLPAGKKIGIVTNGGGAGVMSTDSLIDKGLTLANLSDETKNRFEKAVEEGEIPDHSTLKNPVDIVGDASSERYEKAIEIMLEDDNVDLLIVVCLFQSPALDKHIVEKLGKMQEKEKPIITIASGGEFTHSMSEKIEKRGIPVYQTPEDAVQAIRGLCECCKRTR
ncbi:MAG: CoA-binding protein [Candidatus Thermoplasmatota archaeon]|nr:CoA-binding protein [Candidatus Thermoplasmatota archaeon]MBS3789583.1 CoA-binding protein [Candidatus Thermoplasmatota archaeon]